ncbi:uncharacterized protein [Lolium perenne]|uniref:uncharacterized protein n=1 Tax=Lolium perenne TaxID=4522 RepID=UPI003A99E8C1
MEVDLDVAEPNMYCCSKREREKMDELDGPVYYDYTLWTDLSEKASDDDFVRKAVLVLIGTVLAPSGPKTVDRDHYCLVEDVPRIFKINWNHFTLRYLLDNLSAYTRSAAKGRGWPVGNLCLTQLLYWEKVVVVDDPTYIPHKSIRPLMKNWTEAEAERRSQYDYANGRGRGKVKIINDLTPQANASAETKQNTSQNGEQSRSTRSRQRRSNKDILLESLKKELTDHIDTQLALVPKRCAEEVLKMLNKNGVMYKPVEGSESDKGGDEEEDTSIHIDDSSKKEFMYKNSSDELDALISNLTKNSGKFVTPPKHNGVPEAGDNVYVTPGNLRNTEGLFAEYEDGVSSAVPTQQEIEVAALYVKTISKIPKQASKGVYKNEFGASLSSAKLNVVLAHEWLSDDIIDAAIGYLSLRVGSDRMLCPIGQISQDIQEANNTCDIEYPDVDEWPIKSYDIPKQTDTNSCGLWVLQCMEHWDEDQMTCPVSQTRVDESRESTVANIIFSPNNILDRVKNKIRLLAKT